MLRYILTFITALNLILNFSARAQDQNTGSETISLNHLALHVHDLEKSTKFYEEIVRLKRIPEPFKDGLHEWFSMGGKSQLHLIAGAHEPISRNRHNHLCFSVQSIESFIENLERNNVEWTDWAGKPKTKTLRVDGVTQLYFTDPDGYWIEINNDGFVKK